MDKAKIVEALLEQNILLSPDVIGESIDLETVKELNNSTLLVLNKDVKELITKKKRLSVDWLELERASVLKQKKNQPKQYNSFIKFLSQEQECSPVKVLFSYEQEPRKRSFQDFVSLFNHRFNELENLLKQRQELQNLTSISRVLTKQGRETVSIIGMVENKSVTKNDNVILTLEDPSGKINVLVNKNKPDIYLQARDLVLDEVVGVCGVSGNKIIFANNIVIPDIPIDKAIKKCPEEVYAAFLGDPHFGSKKFLRKEFEKFLLWIQGKAGSEAQKEIAKKVKYLFLTGDLVEGVGVYPQQEEDLEILDIKKQYDLLAELLKKIPQHVHLIICAGNHDSGRLEEPQPPLYKDFAEELWKMPNTTLVSNPALVNIESGADFSGFDVLLYHGYSLIYYSENVESIRKKGGQKRPDLIMKFLLQRRHLAPTHSSVRYLPTKKDHLLIKKVPDFFVTGHIHRVTVKNYRGVTLINCSTWSDISEDQEKRGLEPQPCRLPLINLKTRQAKIMNFSK
jgi:DNA polymerase II small subunit